METTTMTLAEFLTARLDEDEAAAREAIADRGRVRPDYGPDFAFDAWPDAGVPAVLVGPERVLAEVEAKRRIVELHGPWSWAGGEDCSSCGDVPQVEFPCATLRALALPYADHPDYDEGWRP